MKSFLLAVGVIAAGLAAAPAATQAQSYPAKPVKVIVPLAPGGGTDVSARVLAKTLTAKFGQQFFVENRPGGNSIIGIEAAAKSPGDGYTLLAMTSAFAISPATEKSLPYDPRKDLIPILIYGEQPLVLIINPKVPANNADELLKLAKAKPGDLTFAMSDQSTILATDMLRRGMNADIVGVEYKGSGQALTDVIGGQITGMITSFGAARSQIKAGTVRAIAVTTTTRSQLAPELPTLNESIAPGYDLTSWYALLAPAGTPQPVLTALNKAVVESLDTQEAKDLFVSLGMSAITEPLDAVNTRMVKEFDKWEAVVKAAGMKPQ